MKMCSVYVQFSAFFEASLEEQNNHVSGDLNVIELVGLSGLVPELPS